MTLDLSSLDRKAKVALSKKMSRWREHKDKLTWQQRAELIEYDKAVTPRRARKAPGGALTVATNIGGPMEATTRTDGAPMATQLPPRTEDDLPPVQLPITPVELSARADKPAPAVTPAQQAAPEATKETPAQQPAPEATKEAPAQQQQQQATAAPKAVEAKEEEKGAAITVDFSTVPQEYCDFVKKSMDLARANNLPSVSNKLVDTLLFPIAQGMTHYIVEKGGVKAVLENPYACGAILLAPGAYSVVVRALIARKQQPPRQLAQQQRAAQQPNEEEKPKDPPANNKPTANPAPAGGVEERHAM